jgi:MFS family permease
MGVKLRDGVSKLNFLSFLLMYFVTFLAIYYLIMLSILLIEDPKHYNVPKADLGRVTGNVGFLAEILVLIYDPFMGVIFDTLGRKGPTVIGLIVGGVGLIGLPYGHTVYPTFFILRSLVSLGVVNPLNAPYLPDYVEPEYQGKANSYCIFMIVLTKIITGFGLLKLSQVVSI